MKRNRGNGQGSIYQRKPGAPWIISWWSHDGIRNTKSSGTTDKAAANRILAKHVANEALRREGVIDVRMEALAQEADRPIDEHVSEFERSLAASGVSSRQVKLVSTRLRRIVAGCGIQRWKDVSASRVMDYLKTLRDDQVTTDRRTGEETGRKSGISAQTFNFYLQSIKQFARWMVKDRRVSDSPLSHLQGLNVKAYKRRHRRVLLDDELRRLIKATMLGQTIEIDGETRRVPVDRFGMTADARAMLYRVAVETGLRSGELRSLTASSFDLDVQVPVVRVKAAYSKRRRDDVLPMRRGTADAMKVFLGVTQGSEPVFNMPSRDRVAKMLRADLADADIPEADAEGRNVDFHALRHTFISNLASGGVHPKTAQALARHSTITLTMDRYTHQHAGDELAALEVLPDLSQESDEQLRATGTEDGIAARSSRRSNSSAKPGLLSAARRDEPLGMPLSGHTQASSKKFDISHGKRSLAPVGATERDENETVGEGFEPTVSRSLLRFSRPVH